MPKQIKAFCLVIIMVFFCLARLAHADDKKLIISQRVDFNSERGRLIEIPNASLFCVVRKDKVDVYSSSAKKIRSLELNEMDSQSRILVSGKNLCFVNLNKAGGTSLKIVDVEGLMPSRKFELKDQGIIQDVAWDEETSILFLGFSKTIKNEPPSLFAVGYKINKDTLVSFCNEEDINCLSLDKKNKKTLLCDFTGLVLIYDNVTRKKIGSVHVGFAPETIVLLNEKLALVFCEDGAKCFLISYSDKISAYEVKLPLSCKECKGRCLSSGIFIVEDASKFKEKSKFRIFRLNTKLNPFYEEIGEIELDVAGQVFDISSKPDIYFISESSVLKASVPQVEK